MDSQADTLPFPLLTLKPLHLPSVDFCVHGRRLI